MSRKAWEAVTDEAFLHDLSELEVTALGEQLWPLDPRLVDGDADVVPGVRVLDAPGHAPGHLVVEIDGAALYLSDAMADELHAVHPDWAMSFEPDAAIVAATRRRLLGRAADEGLVVAAAHVPAPARVRRSGDGFALTPL